MTGARLVVGCGGHGVIGGDVGKGDEPAVALMALRLPGAALHAAHLSHDALVGCRTTADLRALTGAPLEDVAGWIVFVDPGHVDADGLVHLLESAYPGVPIVGGLASGPHSRASALFLGDLSFSGGAVCLALGGDYELRPIVAGSCHPVGEAWTITGVDGNLITTIAGLPAYEVLRRTYESMRPEHQAHARLNLAVGFAIDEYKDDFGRGDFVVHSLEAVDRRRGALATDAAPRVGQTVQFHVRDRDGGRELETLLARELMELGRRQPVGAVLCADAHYAAHSLAPVPLAVLRCAGVVASRGHHARLHGFAASLGLIVPAA